MNEATESPLSNEDFERIVKSIGIPPMPTVLIELSREAAKEEADFAKIEKLLAGDIALSAALLKTVNSPLFGLPRKTTSLRQAVSLLGLTRLTHLTRGFSLRQTFAGGKAAIELERFWKRAARMAEVTGAVARALKNIDPEEGYSFGLFRDCGRAVLLLRFPNYPETLELIRNSDRSQIAIERERHPADHANIGYVVAKTWNLPEQFCQAIRCHHDADALHPEAKLLPLSQHLVAASILADHVMRQHLNEDDSMEWSRIGPAALNHLCLGEDDFAELQSDIATRLSAEE